MKEKEKRGREMARAKKISFSPSTDGNTGLRSGEGAENVKPSHTLSYTLRETLGLTGTKVSCDEGACGAAR